MILVLAMLLVGSQAELFNLVSTLSDSIKNSTVEVVDTVSNGVNNAATVVSEVINSTAEGDVVPVFVNVVETEVAAITQPVVAVVAVTVSSQCELLQKLLGVDYTNRSQLNDEELKKLTLEYTTSSVQINYNLTDAAEMISKSSNFDPDLPLIIFMHGFLSDTDSTTVTSVVDAYHKIGEYNVLALDSTAYIRWFYLRAVTYVRYIGERLGEVLAAMVEGGLNPKSIHLIGHSLGAHIAGFTGKQFTQLTGQQVGRITGLDPAGPCFFNASSDMKLNATDAENVVAIHTAYGTLGLKEPVGRSDFYPNGGTQQPGCLIETCSHRRVVGLYAESILDPEAFVAVNCTGWSQFRANECEQERVLMGYGTTSDTEGQFYLQTNSSSPYGLGEAGANYTSNEGIIKSLESI